MAKLNTSLIKDFDKLSDAEKVKALLELEVADEIDLSKYVAKDVFDKASSDLASTKKALREKQSAEEVEKLENEQKWKELEENYNALLRQNSINEKSAKLIGLGYDEVLAKSTAEAMFDGKFDVVLDNQKKMMDTFEKKIRGDVLGKMPKPSTGNTTGTGITKEQFENMSYKERVALHNENPELYAELNK